MSKSINKLIDEQIKRWELDLKKEVPVQKSATVITISRECGSQGYEVAEHLSRQTGFDLFHHEIVEAMVETSKNSRMLLETLDEKSMNVVDDVVSYFINAHHLWPDEYSKLLFRVINTIGRHGRAIILGRGGNCILSNQDIFRVRIVAPLAHRIASIQHDKDLNKEDAQKYIISTDANRSAFVKRYCNCETADPANYDLVLNTGTLSVEKAVQVVMCALD